MPVEGDEVLVLGEPDEGTQGTRIDGGLPGGEPRTVALVHRAQVDDKGVRRYDDRWMSALVVVGNEPETLVERHPR